MKLDTRVQYQTEDGILTGIVVGIQRTDNLVGDMSTGETWPGIRFEIRDEVTGQRMWTTVYPDKEATR